MRAITQPIKSAFVFCLFVTAAVARAQLNVDIVGVGSKLFPIAVAHFDGEGAALQAVSDIIRADLARSGRFINIDAGAAPVSETSAVDLGGWEEKGADAFVAGSVMRLANGKLEIRFRLYDTVRRQDLGGLSLLGPPKELRMSAHRIADAIHQKLLGERGMFATHIAYITRHDGRYQLQIADSDGENARAALTSAAPIISPAWSPNGAQIAYVSFEREKPIVYLHDLPSGQRAIVSNQRGSNSAPAWSPDGRQIALALSLTGNTQLYLINADGSGLRRLSNTSHIDTEPQFSPDGRSIYFTSDRGGAPQIYRMSARGEIAADAAQRVTFNGGYNTSPRLSPDGKLLAYISRADGAYRLYVQDLDSGNARPLTDTRHDASPSFAANSQYILYITRMNGRSVLAVVSIDGRTRWLLPPNEGNARAPSWGPSTQTFPED